MFCDGRQYSNTTNFDVHVFVSFLFLSLSLWVYAHLRLFLKPVLTRVSVWKVSDFHVEYFNRIIHMDVKLNLCYNGRFYSSKHTKASDADTTRKKNTNTHNLWKYREFSKRLYTATWITEKRDPFQHNTNELWLHAYWIQTVLLVWSRIIHMSTKINE